MIEPDIDVQKATDAEVIRWYRTHGYTQQEAEAYLYLWRSKSGEIPT